MPQRELPSDIMGLVNRLRNRRESASPDDIKHLAGFILDEDAKSDAASMTEAEADEFIRSKGFHIANFRFGYRYISGELQETPRSYLAILIPPGRNGIGIAVQYLRGHLDQKERHAEILKSGKLLKGEKLDVEIQGVLGNDLSDCSAPD